MKRPLCLLFAWTIAFAAGAADAQVVIHTPVSVQADSRFSSPTYDESNLIDAIVTPASINTSAIVISGSSTANFGDAWAVGQSGADGVVVLDMGSTFSFDGLLYAQRTFAGNNSDDYGAVLVWIEPTDPGPATIALPASLGGTDAIFALLQDDNGSTLRRYDFSSPLTGRYAVLYFMNGEVVPGGQELRLFSVPEPSGLLLGAILLCVSTGTKSRFTVRRISRS